MIFLVIWLHWNSRNLNKQGRERITQPCHRWESRNLSPRNTEVVEFVYQQLIQPIYDSLFRSGSKSGGTNTFQTVVFHMLFFPDNQVNQVNQANQVKQVNQVNQVKQLNQVKQVNRVNPVVDKDSKWWNQRGNCGQCGNASDAPKCVIKICNLCKWHHVVAKFTTHAIGVTWWPNLQLIQVTPSDAILWPM